MTAGSWRRVGGWIVALFSLQLAAHAAPWFPLGPFGGDARAIAVDPLDSKHLFLGTETGWLYDSKDGGLRWTRISQIQHRSDLVLDHILVDGKDSRHLVVGVWTVDRPDGGIYVSQDGGRNWYSQAEMRGQSVRALARSLSNPQEIVAGTLHGVFRSMDNGTHWTQISPPGSTEIHEIESIAIDPKDPNIIYAGTWHLPWKTVDGGAHWENIKEGIIDDSDVFSILVDPKQPSIVYASACSGIYKSTDAAAQFRKVQGIPSAARRTRKLMQDPGNLNIVYAGTTEGLYKTTDAGEQWARLTPSDVIINDVFVDPANDQHVLLATDRGGVLRSEDGGQSFQSSNAGFSARQVTAYAIDHSNPSTIYVGVVNDKNTGGVFQSTDGGITWQQQSNGLGGRDVFSLASTQDGTLLAGTGHGIFRLKNGQWGDSSSLEREATAEPQPAPAARRRGASTTHARAAARNTHSHARAREAPSAGRLDATIYTLIPAGDSVFAGTSDGLLRGDADGVGWVPMASLQMPDTRFVAAQGKVLFVGGLKRLALSLDGGGSWDPIPLPSDLTQVAAVSIDGHKNLWVGGREGVWSSTDYGQSWKALKNLFMTEVDGIYFDKANDRVLVTNSSSPVAFAVQLPSYKVSFWDTGWKLRFIRPVGDHLIGATLFDGMVVQPRMVESPLEQPKPVAPAAETPAGG